ncbi:hypothetical protein CHS0354_008693 [Potamilus streckersoni]|uniref:Phosphatidylinositol-4,5-bisphosphate 4-phosphatase n=1 Tax=Potamilus streckersoni TaxID=2493646 RepID=A0AAE0THD3_9BIVA|nr:hypothetical protein CHS0354_008693 [Potamilus streckersoni]
MADQKEERRPLLENESINTETSPSYLSQNGAQNVVSPPLPTGATQGFMFGVPPIGPDELPPPYTPTVQGGIPMINCKVCQALINVEGRSNQHVVKCTVCQEATPIKDPPPGKKYVRCPCNCLLICRAGAQKISCPRQNCRRIISIGGTVTTITVQSPGTNCRVHCVQCSQVFLFNVNQRSMARCPHCNHVSSVGPEFARRRAVIYLILGLIFLGAGIGVTVGTFEAAEESGGIYTVWIGAFVVGLLFLVRSLYFCTVKTSTIIGPASGPA